MGPGDGCCSRWPYIISPGLADDVVASFGSDRRDVGHSVLTGWGR